MNKRQTESELKAIRECIRRGSPFVRGQLALSPGAMAQTYGEEAKKLPATRDPNRSAVSEAARGQV